jgi:hypothetical protein
LLGASLKEEGPKLLFLGGFDPWLTARGRGEPLEGRDGVEKLLRGLLAFGGARWILDPEAFLLTGFDTDNTSDLIRRIV